MRSHSVFGNSQFLNLEWAAFDAHLEVNKLTKGMAKYVLSNTNIASLTATRALQGTDEEMKTAMERLATGRR